MGDIASDSAVFDCLRQVLADGSEPERCLAVPTLADHGGPGATQLLIAHLHDPDPDMRGDTALALAKRGDRAAIAPLMANLREDPVSDVKLIYVRALQALGARESSDLLALLAIGRSEDEGIAWEDVQADWDDWLDVQRAAIEALGVVGGQGSGEEIVGAIVNAINDPEGQDLWAEGSQALANLGGAGCAALAVLLAKGSALNRKRAAAALRRATCRASADLLEMLAGDEDATVRIAAVEAAAGRGLEGVCVSGLQDVSPEVRAAALSVFGGLSTKMLAGALDDSNPKVQAAACLAIESTGKPCAGLGLTRRIERLQRRAPPETLAVMVAAMAVAEPTKAATVIEDMVNHPATATPVRLASLRALGRLKSAGAVALLAEAAADARQDIRLEAIASLGCVGEGEGESAHNATEILASAIAGDLVAPPPDWQPEEDNVTKFAPKKGALAAGEEGVAKVRLDREGNVIAVKDVPDGEGADAPAQDQDQVPLSTLAAILDARPPPPAETSRIELDAEDLSFLELTSSRPGRRRVSPETKTPAHLDVRRLAARIAGETGRVEQVHALADAVTDRDHALCEAAMAALEKLAARGIDITPAQDNLLQQAAVSDQALRCRAIRALAGIYSEEATRAIREAMGDTSGVVRATATAAAGARGDLSFDLDALCRDRERNVRLAAARAMAHRPAADAIPVLFDFALAENAVHLQEAARLLGRHGRQPVEAVLSWIAGPDRMKRRVGLEMLPIMLEAGGVSAGV